MANVLRVTPQEVNEKAKAITAVKARMEDLLTELDGRIKTMNTEDWIGDAGSTYGNQFVLLYNQVIRSMDTVQQYANNLSCGKPLRGAGKHAGQHGRQPGLDRNFRLNHTWRERFCKRPLSPERTRR